MSSSLTRQLQTPNFVCIDENVFLAPMKCHKLIIINKIKRVLTLTLNKPRYHLSRFPGVYYKHITADEYYKKNIIFYFEECYQYINEAQSYDENIVIMSQNIESMSVSIGISFLMKKYRISYVEALTQVLPKWTVSPRDVFIHHLCLWQYMGFRLKANEPFLRRVIIDWFRFEFEGLIYREDFDVDRKFNEFNNLRLEFYDLRLNIEERDQTFNFGLNYFCMKCTKVLFRGCHVIKNDAYFDCKYIYTEPMNWFLDRSYHLSQSLQELLYGLILCNKCEQHIGIYNWDRQSLHCECPLHRGLPNYLIYRFFSNKIGVKE